MARPRKPKTISALRGLPDLMMKYADRSSRSSGLAPHYWMLAFLIVGAIGTGLVLPTWISAAFVVLISGVLVSFVSTNRYLVVNNPDVLRSEDFNKFKIALQSGLVGDANKGLHEANEDSEADVDAENALDVVGVEKSKDAP